MKSQDYYQACYAETGTLRDRLRADLTALGLDVIPGSTNALLAHLPEQGPDADTVRS